MKTPRILRKQASERGAILVTAIMVIVVMLIIAIPFLVKLSAGNRSTERAARALTALNLAEAGVDKVMWHINIGLYGPGVNPDPEKIIWTSDGTNDIGNIPDITPPDYPTTPAPGSRKFGKVSILLTPPTGPEPQKRFLESTGLVPFIANNTVDRTVRVTLQKYYESIFDFGFFVDYHFYINNNFLLDSYDSSDLATYDQHGGDVIFGTNSYDPFSKGKDGEDGSWTVITGGASSDVYGTVAAGGDLAGAGGTPPEGVLNDVIYGPKTDVIFHNETPRMIMEDEYYLPPVDVMDLPPKDILGTMEPLSDWFNDPYLTGLELDNQPTRIARAPLATDIIPGYMKGQLSVSGDMTLDGANNVSGLYTSVYFNRAADLTIKGDVTIYLTGYNGSLGQFYMDGGNSIKMFDKDSSLTLILGDTSFYIQNQVDINAPAPLDVPTGGPDSPGLPSSCVILGTNQFTPVPTWKQPARLNRDPRDRGVMYLENSGIISAAMYIPRAPMIGTQGNTQLNIYGAAIAHSMYLKTNADFHYDKALGDMTWLKGGLPKWKIINWREKVGD